MEHDEMFGTGDESTQVKDVKDTDNPEFANLHFHRIPKRRRVRFLWPGDVVDFLPKC